MLILILILLENSIHDAFSRFKTSIDETEKTIKVMEKRQLEMWSNILESF
jgi:hypothetical protein